MIKYESKEQAYYNEEGEVLHTGHNIEWNRKVNIDMNDTLWFGAFNGKTMREMFGSKDGTSYVKWMKQKGFNLSSAILDALETGKVVHDVPDFLVSNKPLEDLHEEPAAFALFDQDIADKITVEGQSVLAQMVEKVVRQSHNTITANPEAGRSWEVIY